MNLLALTALALSPSAHAVEGELQFRVHRPALDFAEMQTEGLDPFIQADDIGEDDIDCWDHLGVRDFNLSVPLNDVWLTADGDGFTVDVEFGDLLGTGWTVYGTDEETLDTCPEFEADVDHFAVLDGSFVGTLAPTPGSDGVAFEWVGVPLVTGDLDTEVAWVPDDIVLWFVEDLVFEEVSLAVEEALPPALNAALAEPLLDGEFGGFDIDIALSDVEIVGDGVAMGAAADIAFVGQAACSVPSGEPPGGRSPELQLAPIDGTHVTVGLTEAFVNQIFFAAWEGGLFCTQPEAFDDLAQKLSPLVDSDVTGLTGLASLDAPAALTFDNNGTHIKLRGQHLTVTGYDEGQEVTVLDVVLDVDARVRFGFSPSLTAINVTLHDLELDFTQLRLDHGLGNLGAQVKHLIQEGVAKSLRDDLKRIPVYDSLFYALDLAIEIEEVRPEEGGVALALRLWDVDDAAVDRVAPETTARLVSSDRTSARLSWDGTDDRDGALAWSWQVDGQGWSDWTNASGATADNLVAGKHTLEIKSRDAWLNEDPTPATVDVILTQKGPLDECGCASGPNRGRGAGLGWLALVLAAVGLRRRIPAR